MSQPGCPLSLDFTVPLGLAVPLMHLRHVKTVNSVMFDVSRVTGVPYMLVGVGGGA